MVKNVSNIVLVGFMGTGKTSVGEQLSSRLGMHYVDTDDVVEQMSGRSISDIFAEDGEPTFRQLESEAVQKSVKTQQPCYLHRRRGCPEKV